MGYCSAAQAERPAAEHIDSESVAILIPAPSTELLVGSERSGEQIPSIRTHPFELASIVVAPFCALARRFQAEAAAAAAGAIVRNRHTNYDTCLRVRAHENNVCLVVVVVVAGAAATCK